MAYISLQQHSPRHRRSVWTLVARLMQLRQQRRALAKMDAHQRLDLGISAQDAAVEAAKPIWNVPAHWHN